jgi:putative N6-adenine-specific DNA methylase
LQWAFEKSGRFLAQCAQGLEGIVSAELSALGGREASPGFRGVWFGGDAETLWRVNYLSRLCTRVLAPLIVFDCHSTRYLYRTASSIEWEGLFGPDDTFSVSCNLSGSLVRHSRYAALRLKDAIADRSRTVAGRRPDVDRRTPDVHLDLHIERNRATISLDASGGSLHRRGYRAGRVEAPMQETVAAAMLEIGGWDGTRPLHDPMCGSGTVLAEALMRCSRTPAGYLRERFGFERMPGFDRERWLSVRRSCDSEMREPPQGSISGGDSDPGAIAAARACLSALPWGDAVRLDRIDLSEHPGLPGRDIYTNPPYGLRLGGREAAAACLRELGEFVKWRCPGSRAYVYMGDRSLIGSVGLRPTWRRPLRSGQLDGRLVLFEPLPPREQIPTNKLSY